MAGDVAGAITQPVRILGAAAGAGGMLASDFLSQITGGKVGTKITGQEKLPFLGKEEGQQVMGEVQKNPALFAGREAAGLFSLAAPFASGVGIAGLEGAAPLLGKFGTGASNITKNIIPGMTIGGLSTFGKPGTTAQDVAGGAIAGGATAGIVGGLIDKLATPAKVSTTALSADERNFLSQFSAPVAKTKYMNLGDTAKTMVKWGFKDASPDELANIADQMTGDGGKITEWTSNVAGKVGKIPIPESYDAALKTMGGRVARGGKLIGSTGIATKGSTAQAVLTSIRNAFSGDMNTTNALDALDQARQWEAMGKFFSVSQNPQDKLIAKALYAAADEVTNTIDKQAVDTGLVEALKTPENYNFLAQHSKEMADDFMKVKTLPELRHLAAPWVNTDRLVTETNNTLTSMLVNRMNKMSSDNQNLVMQIAKANPMNWPGLAIQGVTKKVAQAAAPTVGAAGKTAGAVVSAGAKAITESPFLQQVIGQISARSPQAVGGGETKTKKVSYLDPAGNKTTTSIPSVSTSKLPSQRDFQLAILRDLELNGGKNVSKLVAAEKAVTATQASLSTDKSYQAAVGIINDLKVNQDYNFDDLGSPRSIWVWTATNNPYLRGRLGTDDQNLVNLNSRFEQLRNTVVPYLEGRRGGTYYVKAADSYIPSITDNPESARNKLRGLVNLLGSVSTQESLDTSAAATSALSQ